MSERKYIGYNIQELEVLFETKCANLIVLSNIKNELEHRNTRAAKTLELQVVEQINYWKNFRSHQNKNPHPPQDVLIKIQNLEKENSRLKQDLNVMIHENQKLIHINDGLFKRVRKLQDQANYN